MLLALSVSLDELAIGFSLGSITGGVRVSPTMLCFLIGVQGFLMTLIDITLGRILHTRFAICERMERASQRFSAHWPRYLVTCYMRR